MFAENVKLNREIPKQIEFPFESAYHFDTWNANINEYTWRLRVAEWFVRMVELFERYYMPFMVFVFICSSPIQSHIDVDGNKFHLYSVYMYSTRSKTYLPKQQQFSISPSSSSTSSLKRTIENWYALTPKNPKPYQISTEYRIVSNVEQNQYT